MRTDYEQDFHAWALENAKLIRQGRLSELDYEHIVEELESMGARDRRELLSRLHVLIMHLLKFQYQPELRGKSWRLTIIHQRLAIERLLAQSPSLKRFLNETSLSDIYRKALQEALIETELEAHLFPSECPFSFEQILDESFLPG